MERWSWPHSHGKLHLDISDSFEKNKYDKLHGENLTHHGNFIPANIEHDIKTLQFSKSDNLLL